MDVLWSRVKGRLEESERSQAWLARRLGVSRQLISLWITGTRPTPAHRIQQVVGLLDIRTDDLEEQVA